MVIIQRQRTTKQAGDPLDPDSSFEKCCSADVLISHLPLEIIKTVLHTGVAVVSRSSVCSLNLVKDYNESQKAQVVK